MLSILQRSKILDSNAKWWGIKTSDMMEKAGAGIAMELIREYGKHKSYAIICGLGNNGGNGLVTARFLVEMYGVRVTVYLIGREADIKVEESRRNFQILKQLAKKFYFLKIKQDSFAKDIEKHDIVVECLLETDIKGKLHKRFYDVVKKITKLKCKKVAIDFPVPGYKYDLSISLHFEKVKGSKVIDIGIPSEVEQYVGPGEIQQLYIPAPESYKTQNGELFVFGGSNVFHGAPLMAIMTASKFIGSVYFYTTSENRELLKTLKSKVCEFITVQDNEIEKYANYADAFLIGPGLQDNLLNRSIIHTLFKLFPDKPKVIDAYAIAMAIEEDLKNCILTPHRGELRHIWGEKVNLKTQRLEGNLRRFAKESGAIVILKGHVSILFNRNGEVKFNKTGNAGMAKGGTGDIMAGLTGAFLTKNDPWLAAQCGIFINGLAGDLACKEFGYNFSATDIVPFIQKAVKLAREFKSGYLN